MEHLYWEHVRQFIAESHAEALIRQKKIDAWALLIEREERKHIDDDDFREIESWQYFWGYNFLI